MAAAASSSSGVVDVSRLKKRVAKLKLSNDVQENVVSCIERAQRPVGDTVYDLKERVAQALMELGHTAEARVMYQELADKFGSSSLRVSVLEGMLNEAEGKYDKAERIYKAILKKDGTHPGALKRQVALHKSQGDTDKAIKALNSFLEMYSGDEGAWLELADLYIEKREFGLACFCMEELILLAPYSHMYHLRYGELKYTLGTKADVSLAREYFAQSLELKPSKNVRALYGLLACLQSKFLAPDLQANKSTIKWCTQKLKDEYETASAPKECKALMLKCVQ